ncbi:MAG: TonB family protein [Ignavibacteria bacterium]|nr:TonB family protein [Ignavibacteria bacterium]
MSTAASSVQALDSVKYGASEIKRLIQENTKRAFTVTMLLLALIALYTFIGPYISEMLFPSPKVVKVKLSKFSLEALPPPQSQTDEPPPPPPPTNLPPAPAARAGTPVPVPDAEITAEMQDFANVDQINRSAAEGGSGEDNGALSFNPGEGAPPRDDDEPIMDAFEFEDGFLPVTDEADLVKKLRDLYTTTQSFRMGFEGTVLVSFVVGKDGRISEVRVDAEGSSGYKDLDEAAKTAIRGSVYTPAKNANGQPTACRLQRPVTFRQR